VKVTEVKDTKGEHRGWMIFCPGCGHGHVYDTRWTFNGDMNKPTFTPSYLSRCKSGPEKTLSVCHSFVTDGRIKFLNDCTHALAGQTVDLPDEFT